MHTAKYFIRVYKEDQDKFLDHLEARGLIADHISSDLGPNGFSCLYQVWMDGEEALSLKLSLQVIGCVRFG